MNDTNRLEWKLRKLKEEIDMLRHALEINRNGGHGWHLIKPCMGKVRPWWMT